MTTPTATAVNVPAPGRARRVATTAAWTLAFAAAWVLSLDFSRNPTLPALEPSWNAVLAYAAGHGWQFGRDILFTYGPLGHVVVGSYAAATALTDFVFQLVFKGVYLLGLVALARGLPFPRRLALLAAGFLVAVLTWQEALLLGVTGAGPVLAGTGRGDRLLAGPLLALLAAAALIKATFLFMAGLTVGAVALHAVVQGRWRWAVAAPTLFAAMFLVGWRLLGQEFSVLPGFLRGSAEITAGYSQAMSLPANPALLAAGLLVMAAAAVQGCVLFAWSPRKREALPMGLLLGAAWFQSWKLGYSRADAHTLTLFFFAVPATLAAPVFFGVPRRGRGLHWTVAALTMAAAVWAVATQMPAYGNLLADWLRSRARDNPRILRHPGGLIESWRLQFEGNAAASALPQVRAAVGGGTVDVFGNEQAIAILNGLHYTPRPVFQSYSAFTPFLARANLDFYRSDRAPAFVLFKLQTIDGRLATLDDGPTLLQVLRDYTPVLAENDYLLLRRRPGSPAAPGFAAVREGSVGWGEPLELPADDGQGTAAWCELEMRGTLAGKLLNFLYHPPEIVLETTDAATGRPAAARLVPGMARSGFLVSPLPASERDLVMLQAGRALADRRVRSLRVLEPVTWLGQRLFAPRVGYRLATLSPFGGGGADPDPNVELLLRQWEGYTDIFRQPALLVQSPVPRYRFTVGKQTFLLVHPPGEVHFAVPAGATTVTGSFAIAPVAVDSGKTDGVDFRIDLLPPAADNGNANAPGLTTLWEHRLDPRGQPADRGAQRFAVPLPPGAAGGRLILRTLPGPANNADFDWAGWSDIGFEPAPSAAP